MSSGNNKPISDPLSESSIGPYTRMDPSETIWLNRYKSGDVEALGKLVKNPKPPTVYRALEFLQKAGLVHRIESMNAYVACGGEHAHGGGQFLICDECGDVQEVHISKMEKNIQTETGAMGFKAGHWSAEIHGTCKDCQD